GATPPPPAGGGGAPAGPPDPGATPRATAQAIAAPRRAAAGAAVRPDTSQRQRPGRCFPRLGSTRHCQGCLTGPPWGLAPAGSRPSCAPLPDRSVGADSARTNPSLDGPQAAALRRRSIPAQVAAEESAAAATSCTGSVSAL